MGFAKRFLCSPLFVRSWIPALLCAVAGFGLLWAVGELPNGLRWPARIFGVLLGGVGVAGLLQAAGPLCWRLTEGVRDQQGRWDWLLVGLLVVQHGVMIWNSSVHDPVGNPDWHRHWDSVEAWSQGRMVDAAESRAVYYAPLAYWPPALAHALDLPRYGATRVGMLFGVLYSVVAILFLLRICRLIAPGSAVARRTAVFFLALLPLWYKSCAMQRPEPLVAAFCMAAFFYGGRIFATGDGRVSTFVKFGTAMGLALLTRQWAVFIVPGLAVGFLLFAWEQRGKVVRILPKLGLAVLVSVLIAGWFYAALHIKHGTALAGPTAMRPESAAEKGWEFYADLHPEVFFHRPIAWAHGNRFWPIFLSEIYGDYYGYWWNPRMGEGMEHDYSVPLFEYGDRLGRANWSGLPLFVMCMGLIVGTLVGFAKAPGHERTLTLMMFVALLGSFGGLLWFALGMRHGYGTQPVYVLQIAPLCAVLVGLGWEAFFARFGRLAGAFLALYIGLSLPLAGLLVTGMPKPVGWDKIVEWVELVFLAPVAFGIAMRLLLGLVRPTGRSAAIC